jgi:gliding motility-associated-like protein
VGDTVHLWAISPDGNTFSWQPNAALYIDNGRTVASPVVTTTYTASIQNVFGCQGSDTVRVMVFPVCDKLYFPNAFSPNGDGVNDIFTPLDFGQTELLAFQVFNRHGQLLFATDDWMQGWDGTFGGVPQPMDTYAYIVRVQCQGRVTVIGGNMTLLR